MWLTIVTMLTEDVIAYFADPAIEDADERRGLAIRTLADALEIKPPSIYGWKETVPPLRQLQIERITHGKLKAAANVFEIPSGRKPDHEDAAA